MKPSLIYLMKPAIYENRINHLRFLSIFNNKDQPEHENEE